MLGFTDPVADATVEAAFIGIIGVILGPVVAWLRDRWSQKKEVEKKAQDDFEDSLFRALTEDNQNLRNQIKERDVYNERLWSENQNLRTLLYQKKTYESKGDSDATC